MDSDIVKINKIFNATKKVIPQLCDICYDMLNFKEGRTNLDNIHKSFKNSKLGKSETIGNLKRAALNNDSKAYSQSFNELKRLYEKSDLLKKRVNMLNKLKDVAPEWASAIANRKGIHGLSHVPADIENAWKWKHLSNEIPSRRILPLQALSQSRTPPPSSPYPRSPRPSASFLSPSL